MPRGSAGAAGVVAGGQGETRNSKSNPQVNPWPWPKRIVTMSEELIHELERAFDAAAHDARREDEVADRIEQANEARILRETPGPADMTVPPDFEVPDMDHLTMGGQAPATFDPDVDLPMAVAVERRPESELARHMRESALTAQRRQAAVMRADNPYRMINQANFPEQMGDTRREPFNWAQAQPVEQRFAMGTVRITPLEGFGPIAMDHGVFLSVAVPTESILDPEREDRVNQPAITVFLHTLLRYLAGREWSDERKRLAVGVWNRHFPAWISATSEVARDALTAIATHLGMEVGAMNGPNQRHAILVARAGGVTLTAASVAAFIRSRNTERPQVDDVMTDEQAREATARRLQDYADLTRRRKTPRTPKVASGCPALQGFTQPEEQDDTF